MIEESDLLRFVEGECSRAEAAAIQAWIAAAPARRELLDELRAVWRLTGDVTRPWDVGAARSRLLRARRGGPPPGAPTLQLHAQATDRPLPHRWRTATVWPARIAAAVALLVAGAALWSHRSPPAPPREYATARSEEHTSELQSPIDISY